MPVDRGRDVAAEAEGADPSETEAGEAETDGAEADEEAMVDAQGAF